MRFLTKDKGFYKSFFSLWRVLVLNHIIVLGVNLADNIMLGSYSEPALSGATACNQVQFVFLQITVGLGNALVVMCSQYWGARNTEPIKRLTCSALACGVTFSLVLFTLTTLMPEQVIDIFTDSPEIIAQGMEYLKYIKYTYPVFAVTSILLASMRSVESVKVGFIVSLITLVVNIFLNYVLIFGKLGFESMGAKGAAIATLIARCAELAYVLIHVLFIEKNLPLKLSDLVKTNGKYLAKYVKTCIPFVVTDGLFGLSTALQTVILGNMAPAAMAANSVSSTLFGVLKVASIGSAASSSVLIGKSIGEGKTKEQIKDYSKTLQFIYVCIGICTGLLLFAVRRPVIGMYGNISDEAKILADGFLLVLCVTCVGTSYQMPVNTGIVRGGGDSKFVLILDIISIWGIVLPLSFAAAFLWNWHPVAVIACLNADQIFKCLPAAIKVNRYNWIKRLAVGKSA